MCMRACLPVEAICALPDVLLEVSEWVKGDFQMFRRKDLLNTVFKFLKWTIWLLRTGQVGPDGNVSLYIPSYSSFSPVAVLSAENLLRRVYVRVGVLLLTNNSMVILVAVLDCSNVSHHILLVSFQVIAAMMMFWWCAVGYLSFWLLGALWGNVFKSGPCWFVWIIHASRYTNQLINSCRTVKRKET